MTLEKDDLFRNVTPGFIFVLVLLSYGLIDKGILEIFRTQVSSILTVAVAFPIGFIIQSTHRFAWHVGCCEQCKMQQRELREFIGRAAGRKVARHFRVANRIQRGKFVAQLIAFALDREENGHFKIRINFLNTYFHALGASALAVPMAILYLPTFFHGSFLFLIFYDYWAITWLVVALILVCGRAKIRCEYELCRRIFIREGLLELSYLNSRKLTNLIQEVKRK